VDASDFKALRAYRLSRALAADAYAAAETWSVFNQRTVGVQLVRAADSVGANIAEATGRWHQADQRRLLYIARGSLRETEHWILVAQERRLLPSDAGAEVPELARTLSGLVKRRGG
jgi:four helix bundle protein